jgi:hypothetical protein
MSIEASATALRRVVEPDRIGGIVNQGIRTVAWGDSWPMTWR